MTGLTTNLERTTNYPKHCEHEVMQYSHRGIGRTQSSFTIKACAFFHIFFLHRYDEALIDINRAQDGKLPECIWSKLEKRKEECQLNVIDGANVRSLPKHEIKLSHEANASMPCMANALKIAYNEKYGRYLIANCDILAEKMVLVEDPFIATNANYESSCYTCHRDYLACIPCEWCPDVAYCSADCMNQNQTHKWECGSFLISRSELEIRYNVQLILMAIEALNEIPRFVDSVLHEDRKYLPTSLLDATSRNHFFFKLSTSAPFVEEYAHIIYETYKCIMSMPKVGALFNSKEKRHFLMHLATHHYRIRKTNSYALTNVLSIVNHSCAPNLVNLVFQTKHLCITQRPVKKGGQLFVNYLFSDPDERRQKWRFGTLIANVNRL